MERSTIKPDHILDAKGLCCPMPAVKTSLRLESLTAGEILDVMTTDPVSKVDLPAWCKNTGNELLGLEEEGDITHIYIRKT